MDIKDVSDVPEARRLCDMTHGRTLGELSCRKGEVPQDRTSYGVLLDLHSQSIRDQVLRSYARLISAVLPYYPPCVRPVEELQPLMISCTQIGTHHRGSRILARVLTEGFRNPGTCHVYAVVQDEEGTAIGLELYNQPEEDKVRMQCVLRPGQVCIIKEPFLVPFGSEYYVLRVDHVSDIIWLEDTDSRIPMEWRSKPELGVSSLSFRIRGHSEVLAWNWDLAERRYTQAIQTAVTSEQREEAYLSRFHANLRLDRPEKALQDVFKARGDEKKKPSDRFLYREAMALYAVGNYDACFEKLRVFVRSHPKHLDALAWMSRAKERLGELKSGSYQFLKMHREATRPGLPLVDCETYIGPITVRDSPGRGKGLFTTKPVKAGELLLCEKAFAYVYVNDITDMAPLLFDCNTDSISEGGQPSLITRIAQKLYHNPNGSRDFKRLYHGDYETVDVSEVDGAPVVDTFLITKIMHLNSFGAPLTSRMSMQQVAEDEDGKEHRRAAYLTCGIWTTASRINHSCIANCSRAFISDMMIIRACRDMDAGTELLFSYHHPAPHEKYAETQAKLSKWGFTCNCALCYEKSRAHLVDLRNRRVLCMLLREALRKATFKQGTSAQLTMAMKILNCLRQTYPTGPAARLLPRLEIWFPYLQVGRLLLQKDRPRRGLDMLVRSLESLGFVVVAYLAKTADGRENTDNAVFEVREWGQVNDYVVAAFFQIMKAYEKLAPELCEAVVGYANVAYSICVGENESIHTIYPEL
ncbi:hypothetical protein F5Y05DRAFT_422891 [Hypoxylon sp. FL0543]|nr:hypothetical protein F5Y05DRAFT_422891 [Hypoxylon sp. FL0543]